MLPTERNNDGNRSEWFRILAEHSPEAMVLLDNQGIARYATPSYESLSGYHVQSREGWNDVDTVHPEDQARYQTLFEQAVRMKKQVTAEYRLVHREGRFIDVEARMQPVADEAGHVNHVVMSIRDITERKRSEQLLESILDNTKVSIYSIEADFSSYKYLAGRMNEWIGVSREELWHQPIRIHDHIHPDDNAALMLEVKRSLDAGLPVSQTFRYFHVDGNVHMGQMLIQPYINDRGEIERIDAITMDITERPGQEMLEASEQRYKSLFENNLDGVFSIELMKGYRLMNANPAFEAITGIPITSLANRCFIGMVHDEDHDRVFEVFFDVLKQGKPRDVECRLAVRTGLQQEAKIASITFVPIYLAGSLYGIHGILKDITQRKREERELIESERRYKALQQSLNRYSNDLANVMKVSELESRVVEEVRSVLQLEDVSIEEVPRGQERRNDRETWIQIGEKRHPVYLRIALDHTLSRIEEEWLETAVHYATILYDNLQLIEDLMKRIEESVGANDTPQWMLRLLFRLSEKERFTLSSDLHDTVLQDLIIWYRKLESYRTLHTFDERTKRELKQIEDGLLDAIHQIRITCNELRPPFLLKMGLVESLKSLFEYTRMFANYEIDFSAEPLPAALDEDLVLGMYRIVQELLNNANKHSQAAKVTIRLSDAGQGINFGYTDDGVGMDLSALDGSFQHMGLAGIEKRVFSLGGTVEFHSAPKQGVQVKIHFPYSI